MSETMTAGAIGDGEAFSFGDPEPVLQRRQILDMLECYHNDRWYEPPVPLDALTRSFDASPHHSSAITLKQRLLLAALETDTAILPRNELAGLILDYLVLGNCYPEQTRNRLGGLMSIKRAMAKYTRRGVAGGDFWWVPGVKKEVAFPAGSVAQLARPSLNQEIYGLPEYMSALQSMFLNENATLFRRRYYLNGAHAGYIMYLTGEWDEKAVSSLKEQLKQAKGPGNFRNLLLHHPAGKDNSLTLKPIADAAAKDEFLGIKNTTRDDILAAHRVPPQLLGIVPANAGGFGNIIDATRAFVFLEINPLVEDLLAINDFVGREVLKPRALDLPTAAAAAARTAA